MRNKLGRLEISILDRLVEHGYEAMVVGGAVRDYLLDNEPLDFDITTNAPYDKLIDIMEGLGELKLAGSSFGVLLVGGVEVATYRNEVCQNNTVLELNHTTSAVEDSMRRDFTINSIYYDYDLERFWDFHDGRSDIKNKIIRAVGNPYQRFNEDYSRILRALYLSSSLDFEIEENTGNAIRELGHCITKVPTALQGKIVKKVINAGCFHKFLKLLEQYDLLKHMFPEIAHTVGLEQNPNYHKYDVWNHTLKVVENAENHHEGNVAFVMGAFLHDVAKGLEGVRGVNKQGFPNDLGHEEVGVPIAKKVCKRLELGKKVTNEVAMYVKWHGARMASTSKSIKHFLFKFKDEFRNIEQLKESFSMLIDFMMCDALAFEDSFSSMLLEELEIIDAIATHVVFKEQIFYSHEFLFDTSIIAKHPKVKTSEIREWIEFFIRQNIVEEEAVLKILDKQVV